jgi:hypothetical protein
MVTWRVQHHPISWLVYKTTANVAKQKQHQKISKRKRRPTKDMYADIHPEV